MQGMANSKKLDSDGTLLGEGLRIYQFVHHIIEHVIISVEE